MKKLFIAIILLIPFITNAQVDTLQLNWDVEITGYCSIGKIHHVYGGFQDSSVTVSIGVQSTWYQVTNSKGSLFSGLESDGFRMSGDTLYIDFVGDISGLAILTISGSNTQEYQVRIYDEANEVQSGFLQGVTCTGAGNYQQLVIPVYIENDNAGNDYIMQIQNVSGTGDAVMRHGQFILNYLHN